MYITTPLRVPFAKAMADFSHSSLLASAGRTLSRLWAPIQRARSRSDEAAEVRAMAWLVRESDPGFASDLLAAADRHESAAP